MAIPLNEYAAIKNKVLLIGWYSDELVGGLLKIKPIIEQRFPELTFVVSDERNIPPGPYGYVRDIRTPNDFVTFTKECHPLSKGHTESTNTGEVCL